MKKFESYNSWINEKFTEDDDPIQSMGIGLMHEIDKFIEEESKNFRRIVIFDLYSKISFCIYRKKYEFVDYLLSIMPDKDTNRINIYLDLAIQIKDNLDIIKLLINKYNADIYFRNQQPVLRAIQAGAYDVLKYFLEELKFDPNFNNGRAFIYACYKSKSEKIPELMIEHGANVNMINDKPLFQAAYHGKTKIMRLLLQHGAKVNQDLIKCADYWKRARRRILVTNLLTKRGLI